mmetsp:Transcript_32821/g.115303  ORF Transcript_32821/g.115303 Transcript_32821/m.115303 type:complete len:237 (-) Transcript_32821:55-765(-)
MFGAGLDTRTRTSVTPRPPSGACTSGGAAPRGRATSQTIEPMRICDASLRHVSRRHRGRGDPSPTASARAWPKETRQSRNRGCGAGSRGALERTPAAARTSIATAAPMPPSATRRRLCRDARDSVRAHSVDRAASTSLASRSWRVSARANSAISCRYAATATWAAAAASYAASSSYAGPSRCGCGGWPEDSHCCAWSFVHDGRRRFRNPIGGAGAACASACCLCRCCRSCCCCCCC